MTTPLVLKLGGALLENETALGQLFSALTAFQATASRPLILVHGGGCFVDELLTKMNIVSDKKNGLRITPQSDIGYITGALAGTANKVLMAQGIKLGAKVVGLSLADGGIATVTQSAAGLGAVGECEAGDPALLTALMNGGFLPIISSIGIDAQGQLLNVNADQAATAICETLNADLVMLSDVEGILDAEMQLIPEMNSHYADELIASGVINGGMEVKVKAALKAAVSLNRDVKLASWKVPERLVALLSGEAEGTKVSS
ncbi:MAG: acetylglutamate kinase [Moritella sp.]|uniref:acetylglutamate kinase n=1 Tax=Moritella sp. TaxID=78556 RepID=UPI0029B5B970|nr:acetylglutamate kinase [Moritella sp.]MDX2320042.1 acetylglutamate kinase [Moritella sp.]